MLNYQRVIGVIQDNIAVGVKQGFMSDSFYETDPNEWLFFWERLGPGWTSPPKVDSWMVYNQ